MILVDTSGWVEFDRQTGSRVDNRLADLIATTDEVATTHPVIMEVAAGARSLRQERELRRLLDRFSLLAFDSPTDFDAAVAIHRRCRELQRNGESAKLRMPLNSRSTPDDRSTNPRCSRAADITPRGSSTA